MENKHNRKINDDSKQADNQFIAFAEWVIDPFDLQKNQNRIGLNLNNPPSWPLMQVWTIWILSSVAVLDKIDRSCLIPIPNAMVLLEVIQAKGTDNEELLLVISPELVAEKSLTPKRNYRSVRRNESWMAIS